MSYLRDRAIVLKSEPFREHDVWVTLYGKKEGKMIAVARGALNLHAKALGHLEPLSEIEVMIAKGSSFDKLAVARIVRPRLYLRERLEYLTVAGTFADLVARLTHPGINDERVFNLLCELMDLGAISDAAISAERSRLLLSGSIIKLLDLLGYAPHIDACAHCHQPLAFPTFAIPSEGGLVCFSCAREIASSFRVPLSPDGVRLIRFLRHRPLADVLQITAFPFIFLGAASAIESFLKQTPLLSPPHASETVMAYTSSFAS
ncbi:MAG TPA: DNA repair protein RecO [Patescibacteria group bacterium]|nr:DNA repair protein RecO [Patescibacteria group bacterium]